MRVLFVASECYPLVKTGGLADVVGALPLALKPFEVETRVLLPAYPGVLDRLAGARTLLALPDLFGSEGRVLGAQTADGLDVLALDAPHLFERDGDPYLGPNGQDWPDNHCRFAALSWTASRIALGDLPAFQPDLVHGHDWQTGLTPAYLRFAGDDPPPTAFTIHNLAFQGLFPAPLLDELRLPPSSFQVDGLEYWGRIGFLKAGLAYADRLTTVSPAYAREIRTAEHGMGLDGLLRRRGADLVGIVNGIDETIWNPATDPALAAPYSARSLRGKATNRRALAEECHLEADDGPLFGVVSRLTVQKGLDLLLEVLPDLLAAGGRLVLLGAGERAMEEDWRAAAGAHPGRVAVRFGYDEPFAHRIQAGADVLVVPSRFEPCGLTQLYALRYGTLPLVARTGGLEDTVIDANHAALQDGVATGFHFTPVTAGALRMALERAFRLFRQPRAWQAMQRRGMTRALDWSVPAEAYVRLYQDMLAAARRRGKTAQQD